MAAPTQWFVIWLTERDGWDVRSSDGTTPLNVDISVVRCLNYKLLWIRV